MHPTCQKRLSVVRDLAAGLDRAPTLPEVCKALDIPDLSAQGYLAAWKRERDQATALTTSDVAARVGLSPKRIRTLAQLGAIRARLTSKGYRYTEEVIQTITHRRTLEVES